LNYGSMFAELKRHPPLMPANDLVNKWQIFNLTFSRFDP